MESIVLKDLSDKIVGVAIEVHKELGNGYLEKIYENALMIEFELRNIPAKNQVPIPVNYKGNNLGEYFADIVVDDKIILKLKASSSISSIHQTQLLHYLKSSGLKVGY